MSPIEPAAITAATLLATKALEGVSGKAGESAWAGMARLTHLVGGKLAGHRDGEAALAALNARPDDGTAVRALAAALSALAADNQVFRAELADLVAQAKQDATIGEFTTHVEGLATVGQVINLAQVRDVHFHLPTPTGAAPSPSPPPPVDVRWPSPDRPISNLPARNPTFTGRTTLLTQLHRNLTNRHAAAVMQAQTLHGLGGVGKTHLVLEYGHRHQADYDLVWWVTAEQPAAIPGQLATLARRLGIPEHAEQAEMIATLFDELRRHDRWLVVFDNADDPSDLRAWWPPGGQGHVLVTSRNPAVSWLTGAALPVDVLPRREAVSFLHRRARVDAHAGDQLAEALGDLPLALEQAAAYLTATAIPPGEYLELLRDRAPELFAVGQPDREHTIATIWKVSLDRIHATTPAAQELLTLCAFLAPDDLPRSLLTQHVDVLPEPLAAAVRDRLAFGQALAALRRYSLVTGAGDALRLHRLVQAVTRNALTNEQQHRWVGVAARLVLAGFPEDADDADTWPAATRLLAHALTVIDHPAVQDTDPKATVRLLHRVTDYLWGRAEQTQARPLAERALAISESRLGPDHPTTATSLNNLATVLHDQGDLDSARTLFERALHIREDRLGPNDPATADSLNSLAYVLHDQSDLDGARTLHQRALDICQQRLGPDHPATAWSLSHLAGVLRDQGDLDRARTLAERALSIREDRLGPDHPDTAWSLNNLATVLHAQGDLAGARTLHERALAIREARLGPDHHDTAWSLNDLALVLADQGDLAGARSLHERALAIREASLGPDHPDTVRTRKQLAAVVAALENR